MKVEVCFYDMAVQNLGGSESLVRRTLAFHPKSAASHTHVSLVEGRRWVLMVLDYAYVGNVTGLRTRAGWRHGCLRVRVRVGIL